MDGKESILIALKSEIQEKNWEIEMHKKNSTNKESSLEKIQ